MVVVGVTTCDLGASVVAVWAAVEGAADVGADVGAAEVGAAVVWAGAL